MEFGGNRTRFVKRILMPKPKHKYFPQIWVQAPIAVVTIIPRVGRAVNENRVASVGIDQHAGLEGVEWIMEHGARGYFRSEMKARISSTSQRGVVIYLTPCAGYPSWPLQIPEHGLGCRIKRFARQQMPYSARLGGSASSI